jgi:electron transfer flavoprotein alpha subunit
MASGRALVGLVDSLKPAAVISAGSPRGNEQLAHLAAFKDLPMAAECTSITLGSPHKVVRARWAGNLLEDANVHSDLLIASVMALAFEPEEVGGTAEVKEVSAALSPEDTVVKVLDRVGESSSGGVTLTDAKVIVSGGRGVGGPEGFGVIEELASLLGGAVGCSRVVTASGWRPHSEQVGQTGSKVAPNLYLACGISGAMQHIAGMKNSKTIIAINTDPEATIFRYADYGIVGDLHQVLPKLIEAVKAAK